MDFQPLPGDPRNPRTQGFCQPLTPTFQDITSALSSHVLMLYAHAISYLAKSYHSITLLSQVLHTSGTGMLENYWNLQPTDAHIDPTNHPNSGINPQLFFDTSEHVISPFTPDFSILKQDLTAFPKCNRTQCYIFLSPTLSFSVLPAMYVLSNYTPSHLFNQVLVTTFYPLQSHIVRDMNSPCAITGNLAAYTVYSFVSMSECEPQQIKHVFPKAFFTPPGKWMRQLNPIIAKKMLPCCS